MAGSTDLEDYGSNSFTFGMYRCTDHGLWVPDPWKHYCETHCWCAECGHSYGVEVLLFFAVNICYEVAHVWERKCGLTWFNCVLKDLGVIDLSNSNWPNLPTDWVGEAAWLQDKIVEMGVAWERDTFGGIIVPVDARVDTSHGIMVYGETNWETNESIISARQPQGHMIPMAFMEEIQQQSFWDRPSDPAEPHKLLHITRTGAVTDLQIRASPSAWRTWLKQRDAVSLELADDLGKALDDDNNGIAPRKRQKLNPRASHRPKKPLPGRGTLLRTGRKLQPRIDKALLKQEQDLEQMSKEAISALAEEQAAAAERFRQSQMYIPPPSDQHDLHDILHYDGSDSDA
jgi:hypothetical protein